MSAGEETEDRKDDNRGREKRAQETGSHSSREKAAKAKLPHRQQERAWRERTERNV